MLSCEICGKECKTVQGLVGHRRLKHAVVSGETSAGDQSGGAAAAVGVMGEQSGDRSEQSSQQSSERRIIDCLRELLESGELSKMVGGAVRDAFEDPEIQKMLEDVWELHHRRGMDVLR